MKRFTRWALLVPATFVAIAWYLLWLHPARPRNDPVYAWIALEIGVVGALSVIYQFVRTNAWTVRAMGVLCYVLGAVVLYLLISSGHWATVPRGWKEGFTDLAGAILIVGGPLLLYGLIATTVDDMRLDAPLARLEHTTDRNIALGHTLEQVSTQQETRGIEQDARQDVAERRHVIADQREILANRRETKADTRETTADTRETAADTRETRQDARDEARTKREPPTGLP